jgi:hypothetical protein
MELIYSTSSVNPIKNLHHFFILGSTRTLEGLSVSGASNLEKDYFNINSLNTITNNIVKEEKEYYNKKVDDLFNLYEDRSNALNLYNIATENDNKKEIILAEIYLNKIEEKLNLVQEEALLLEKVIKMLN